MTATTPVIGEKDPQVAGDHERPCGLGVTLKVGRLLCTRRPGHDGEHVATVPGDIVVAVWS